MRKNTARHWLHACLDLLPVLLIPVFMIYSHRHTLTEQTTVDIQYKYKSNEVNSLDDLVKGNIYYWNTDSISFTDLTNFNNLIINLYQGYLEYDLDSISYADNIYDNSYYSLRTSNNVTEIKLPSTDSWTSVDYVYFEYVTLSFNDVSLFIQWLNSNGLEETEFQYTDYNIIESVEVNDETSSVMNVFMDNFNNAVDKYFNMGNVFNMTNVYQWFNTNIFGGNAPVVIYSVWNIVLYEFVMDLLFLLYGLFMWFIDMCKRLMDKPLDSIK